MLNSKKIITLMSVLIISVTGNVFAYSEGDYHTPTSREEIDYTDSVELPQLKKDRQLQKSSFLENKIKAPLIRYNPNKLKASYSKYEDGLRDAFVADSSDSCEIKEAGHSTAGYIFLTNGYMNTIMSKYSGSYKPDFSDYNIYGLSAIATTYAHEAGHWYYEDSWTWDDQKKPIQIKQETRADRFALQVVDNVPNFSMGGELIHENRMSNWNHYDGIHPSPRERWGSAYNYIKDYSNSRVYFENDSHNTNHLLIADKSEQYEFEAYPPAQYSPKTILSEVEQENKSILICAEDRASYVAGSVAWAIKHNAWNSNSVKYVDAHQYFNDLPKNINATAIIAISGNQYKIIDWYLSAEYLTDNQKKTLNKYLLNLKASYEY